MADPPVPPDPPDSPIPPNFDHHSSIPLLTPSQMTSRKRTNIISDDGNTNKRLLTNSSLAVPSIQFMYSHPSLDLPKQYSSKDQGPYIVHVSRIEPDQSAGTTIRPIIFGKFLFKHNIKNIVKDGVKNVGRNKISVIFSTAMDANNFVNNPTLTSNNFRAVIPTYNVTRMGLIRGVPTEWSMDEFVDTLELPEDCGVVMKARRLSRKKIEDGIASWSPTQTIVLTFGGQVLPQRVFSFHTSMKVEPYCYPTIQCLNCCRFGHIKSQCRSKPRCFKCTQSHGGDSCDTSVICCVNCSGSHLATNQSCPEYSRQRSIKLIMSEENISYTEASQRIRPARQSYAEVAQERFSTTKGYSHQSQEDNNTNTNLSNKISYKKTSFVSRNPRPASSGQGYDKQAHTNIISSLISCLPNGSALNAHNKKDQIANNNEDLSQLLVLLFINIFSKFSDCLPSNVAPLLNTLVESLKHGYTNNPMEC